MKAELTIEESAKLIELGVDEKFASRHTLRVDIPTDIPNLYRKGEDSKSVFTLTDLLTILPKGILEDEQKSDNHIYVCPLSIKWDVKYQIWEVRYDYLEYFTGPELIDALYHLLIWTIDNRYINLKTNKK